MSIVTATTPPPWSVGRQVAARDSSGGIFPPPGQFFGQSGLPGPYVYDTNSARRVPAVARCLQVYAGLCKQMHMDAWRGPDMLPRPRLLDRPDPTRARSWFVQVAVEDYLLEGNAISLVTSRGVDGWPLTVQWVPAAWVYIVWTIGMARPDYYMLGQQLPFDDVIHVRRGADRFLPVRGVGVVEEFLGTLDRVASEEAYERPTLAGAAVPSVAIITPQATLTQDVADQAKDNWLEKYGGAEPGAGHPAERHPGDPAGLVADRQPADRGPPHVPHRRGQPLHRWTATGWGRRWRG